MDKLKFSEGFSVIKNPFCGGSRRYGYFMELHNSKCSAGKGGVLWIFLGRGVPLEL